MKNDDLMEEFTVQLSKYTYIFKKGEKVLLYNPMLQRKLLCRDSFFNKIEKKLIEFNINRENLKNGLNYLFELGFLVQKNNENKILEHIRSITPLNRQELWFHLTEICSGNCYYCRQRKAEINQQMNLKSDDAIAALEIFLNQMDQERQANFVFYGGEPLLNFKTIKPIVKKIEDDARVNKYEYNLFTNGQYVSDEIISFCKRHNFNIILSVDGPEKINDVYRKHKDGSGAFTKLKESYLKLKNAGIIPGLSLVVTSANSKLLDKCIHYLRQEFEPKNIYPNIMHNICNNEAYISERYSARKVVEAYDHFSKMGFEIENVMRKVRCFVEERIKLTECGACGNRLVVFPDGQIGPCEGAIHRGDLKTSLNDDFESNDIFKKFRNRTPFNIEFCLNCPAIGICGGGCPLDPLEKQNNMFECDKRFCDFALECLWYFIDRVFNEIDLSVDYKLLRTNDLKFLYGNIKSNHKDLPFRTGSYYGEVPVKDLLVMINNNERGDKWKGY